MSITTTIKVGELPKTITLPEGKALTIKPTLGSSGTAGVAYLLDQALGGTNSKATWQIGSAALAPISGYEGTQKVLIACTAGSIDAVVADAVLGTIQFSPNKLTTIQPAPIAGARRMEALVKFAGIAAGGIAFNQSTGLSPSNFTTQVKMEMEAPFDAVRFIAVNRGVNAIASLTALVGVTETAETTPSIKYNAPTINGVSYNALQGSTDVNGYKSVTWSGASSVAIPASGATLQSLSPLSDWIPNASINRADVVGGRPLLMYRSRIDGTANNFAFISTYTTALAAPTAAMRNRILQNSTANNDGVANPAVGMTAGATTIEIYPIVRFRVPVLSVWVAGDSTDQCDALVNDKTSCWVMRACMDLSTPEKPVVFANMAGSSQTSDTYIATLRAFLAAGVPPPSVLVAAPASTNDTGLSPNPRIAERQGSHISELIQLCIDYRIPHLVMRGVLPRDDYGTSQEDFRLAINAKIKAAADKVNVIWIEFPELVQGLYPDRLVTKYKYDAVHENELGIEEVMAPKLKGALSAIV